MDNITALTSMYQVCLAAQETCMNLLENKLQRNKQMLENGTYGYVEVATWIVGASGILGIITYMTSMFGRDIGMPGRQVDVYKWQRECAGLVERYAPSLTLRPNYNMIIHELEMAVDERYHAVYDFYIPAFFTYLREQIEGRNS